MSSIMAFGVIYAQDSPSDNKVKVIYPSDFQISKPVRELFETNDVEEKSDFVSRDRENRTPQVFKYTAKDGPEYGNDPSTIQRVMGTKQVAAPLTNWLGQNGGGSCPPDPSGAVGLTQYVQSVNATPFKIFNKTSGAAIGSIKNIGALWTPALTYNDGDPIVLYDKYADRWVLTEFGDNYGANGNKIHIAISQTNDASGAYYLYTYTDTEFPDYLKFSIWADGYYMTSNEAADKVFCFERTAMLAGTASARSISKTFTTGSTSSFFVPMPADADGGLPPAGTALPFFSYYENSWGTGVDAIKIWNMAVTWGTTPAATITGPVSINTASFDGTYNSGWNDISQSSGTQKLDGIGGVLSYRAQWRKWPTYNSVVLCWPVAISTTQRSIKWAELRQTGTTWALFQEGIYAPDGLNRWLGSIAMDDNGSIALCYAVSGTGTSPSLRYTGRYKTDAVGTMTVAEQVAVAGSGVMTACSNRVGDYSQTTLDPDGLTFWHTGEYVASGQPATRIYSFKLPLAVGINEEEVQPSFLVNQSGNVLNFSASKLPSDEEMVVDLFDIEGRQLNGKSIKPISNKFETTIDVSGLAKGTYLVRVGNPNFQRVVKVVVN